MPDERDLVIDVKTPLDAYLEALEATTEERSTVAFEAPCPTCRDPRTPTGIEKLLGAIRAQPGIRRAFLPGDQFLAAALAESSDLLDTALKQNVIIATPSTLIALLKTVAYGWRQSAVAQNAAIIRELGQELYRRLGNFTSHLGRAGSKLGAAVEAYNAAVGSLERQVLPQARRFTDLGVTADSPIPASWNLWMSWRECHRSPRRARRTPQTSEMSASLDPQSARYFALLYSPLPQRTVLDSLFGIEREVSSSLRPGLDHHVAHSRLQWWREECERAA